MVTIKNNKGIYIGLKNNIIFTEMENRVIGELKEVIDPVIMSEEEQHVEFVRIGNAVGIESFEVKCICERWMKEELLLSMEQTNNHIIR